MRNGVKRNFSGTSSFFAKIVNNMWEFPVVFPKQKHTNDMEHYSLLHRGEKQKMKCLDLNEKINASALPQQNQFIWYVYKPVGT